MEYLDSVGSKGATRNLILRALRSFYYWASERGHVGRNPVRELKPRAPKYGPAPSLSAEEVDRLIEAAGQREPRRAWTILMLYSTGARIGSLVAATAEDVRAGSIVFRVTKGGRPYAVPLTARAQQAAAELAALGHETLIGVGSERVRQWVRQAGEETGVRAWPHLFRHSFATHLLERGSDVRTVQELLNHADLSMIPRYTAVSDKRKREAVTLLDDGGR